MKYLSFLLAVLLIAGCTSQATNNLGEENNNLGETPGQEIPTTENENDNQESTFSVSDSDLKTTIGELPFLSSANPAPQGSNFPVNAMLILYFVEESGYLGASFALYERSSGAQISLDTTTFESFTNYDIGLKPSGSDGIIALNPNTQYVLKIEKSGETYYYAFTTGGADTTSPSIENVHFEGNDLVLVLSERVKSPSITASNVVLTKVGESVMTGDFANKRTTATQSYEDKKFFIAYSGLTSGSYSVSISNLKDASGNTIAPYTETITK